MGGSNLEADAKILLSLRFFKNLMEVIRQIKKTINQLGGLQDVIDQKVFRYVDDGSPQLRLL